MSYIHLHIFSSLIFFVAQPLLLLIWLIAYRKNNQQMLKIIFSFFILSAIFSFVSYMSGENTKSMLAGFPAVTDEILDPHEKSSTILICLSIIFMLLSGASFWLNNKFFMRFFIVFATFAIVYQTYAGVLGLRIRHTEIRSQQQNFRSE